MQALRKTVCKRAVARLALLGAVAAAGLHSAARGQGPAVRVVDGRLIELADDASAKRFCWFELAGDKRIERYVLGQIKDEDHLLTRMGAKMPPAPTLSVKMGHKPPGKDVPCWRISAAAKTGGALWAYAVPVPRPKVTWYIGQPPHPHHVASGGDPYEGGVFRIDPSTGAAMRLVAADGLPDALVCHDGQAHPGASGESLWGPVVSDIRAEKGKIVFTTLYHSKVTYDPAARKWTVLYSGEPKVLTKILRRWPEQRRRGEWAIRRAGQIRCKEAVPFLADILARCHQIEHVPMVGVAFGVRDALAAIGDPSCLPRLRAIAKGKNRIPAFCANYAIHHLTVPFSQPQGGLRFRLIPTESPGQRGVVNAYIYVQNATNRQIAFCYGDDWPLAEHLVRRIRSDDGTVVEQKDQKARRIRRVLVAPGQTQGIHRNFRYTGKGPCRLRYRVHVPQAAANQWQKRWKAPEIWHGSVETNEVTIEWWPEDKKRGS